MEKRYNRIIFLLMFFTIVFTIAGSTLAYLNWQTSEDQKTTVTFTVTKDFECAADGGGSITSGDAFIAPTSCTNSTHAIQREVTVMPTIYRNNLTINMNLYLDVNSLDTGLSNSQNFRYALTTSSTSCESGVISSGNLHGLTTGSKVEILNKNYSSSSPQKYYLYIWLDGAETSQSTMNQSFSLSLSGKCTDDASQNSLIQAPILDEGMIPVTIANNGTVTTISSDDGDWYDYDNKEWANVVLVDSDSRSTYKNTTGKTVNQSDILAYYVWIPRYAYKIDGTSSGTSGFMTKADKELLIDALTEVFTGLLSRSEIESMIENGIQTGTFSLGDESVSMEELIDTFNEEYDPDITYRKFASMTEDDIITLSNILSSMAGEYSVSYTLEQARVDVDNGVLTGIFSSSIVDDLMVSLFGVDKMPMSDVIGTVNSEFGSSLVYTPFGTMSDEDKLQLIYIMTSMAPDFGVADYSEYDATIDVESGIATGIASLRPELSLLLGKETISMSEFVTIINSGAGTNLIYTENNFSNYNIDIKFEKKSDSPTIGDAVNTYLTHPAFWWDDNNNDTIETNEILGGLWVGKFSNTGDKTIPTILPNEIMDSNVIRVSFETSLKFAGGTLSNGNVTFAGSSTYGLSSNVDSHMMKNSEWGAVVYLAYSKYGINKDVKLNMSMSGCAVNSIIVNGSINSNCEIAYGGSNNYPQSTTGNITGIFDMSVFLGTYVMGVLSDSNGNPRSGTSSPFTSQFNGLLSSDISYTSGVPFPPKKYYNLYLQSQFSADDQTNMSLCTLNTCGGHALYEIAGWYTNGILSFVNSNRPWFLRGGFIYSNDNYYFSMFVSSGLDGGLMDFDPGYKSVLIVE